MSASPAFSSRRSIGPAAAIALALTLALSACQRPGAPAAPAPTALTLAAEDVIELGEGTFAQGPAITGSIQPARRADLRAEVAGVVLQVLRENGDAVKAGDVLVRIDDTALRDGLAAAQESVRTLSLALEQAQRQLQRQKVLRESGMTTNQLFEDAETRRDSVQSDLAAARTRLAQAQQQLDRTQVRAPFAGVLSERRVSPGDTAQIGKELVKVIDPASLRMEGLVASDDIGRIRIGQVVRFRVNGHGDQEFTGELARINPAANAATRQIEVLVNFTGSERPRLAGLYAEGRIEASSDKALMLPPSAIVREGDRAFAWVVDGGKLRKQAIDLGERDVRSGHFPVRSGLRAGELLVRHPVATLVVGQAASVRAAGAPAAGPASAPASSAAPAASAASAASAAR